MYFWKIAVNIYIFIPVGNNMRFKFGSIPKTLEFDFKPEMRFGCNRIKLCRYALKSRRYIVQTLFMLKCENSE